MKNGGSFLRSQVVLVAALLLATSSILAQQSASVAVSPVTTGVVPSLVSYSGTLKDASGRTVIGSTGVTFLLYKDSQGGAPLWMETQNVTPDKTGHYAVQLGSTTRAGLPSEMFMTGEVRWLGVQIAGEAEQARVLLVAVPYAMKAADAETIGGLPPSAFMLAAPASAAGGASTNPAPSSPPSSVAPPATSNVTTTGGTINTLPLWTTATNLQSSAVSQTGTGVTAKIGIGTPTPVATLDVKGGAIIRGVLSAPATGVATSTGGKPSQAQDFVASSFSSGSSAAINQTFQWKAEAAGNNTATPTGTLNLLFGSGAAAPAETGFKIASNGQFTFAPGQAFPGTGTLTGVTTAAGSGLAGGGTSGTLNLRLLSTCAANQILKWSGSAWACAADANSGGTVTSVGLAAPATDFTAGGSPVTTSGTLNFAWLVAPTSANTANAIVKRDVFGNFSGGTISANTLTGGTVSTNTLTATGVSASNSTPGAASIQGYANATTGSSWGVYGVTQSGASNAYGVVGYAPSSTGSPMGVYGVTGSTVRGLGGSGVFGQNGSLSSTGSGYLGYAVGTWGDGGTPGGNAGVFGTNDDGFGGAFENNSSTSAALLGGNSNASGYSLLALNYASFQNCNIDSGGNLNCTGTKNAVVPIYGGKRKVAMSAIEAPQSWFEDFGSAQLSSGAAVVALDPDFLQTVNTEREYMVIPVPNGECKGLYVTNKTATSFEVRELGGGTSSIRFDYRIVALRRKYEDVRFADHTNDPDPRKIMDQMKSRRQHSPATAAASSTNLPLMQPAIALGAGK